MRDQNVSFMTNRFDFEAFRVGANQERVTRKKLKTVDDLYSMLLAIF
jgi:hypothetical protein